MIKALTEEKVNLPRQLSQKYRHPFNYEGHDPTFHAFLLQVIDGYSILLCIKFDI